MGDYSLDKAMNKMLNESRWGKRFMAISIEEDWEQIMGKTIANYTKSLSMKNGHLTVETDIAPLKNELSVNKKSMIEKINSFYNKEVVTELSIR